MLYRCFNFELLIGYSSSTSYVEYQAEGGRGLAVLVNQLTFERCHSFRFYGSGRKIILSRKSLMPKCILFQCGVSSDVFIGFIVPTTFTWLTFLFCFSFFVDWGNISLYALPSLLLLVTAFAPLLEHCTPWCVCTNYCRMLVLKC